MLATNLSAYTLRKRLEFMKQELLKNGWTYSHTIMHADKDCAYGSCFIKDKTTVYLNKETVDNLQSFITTI